MILGRVLVEKNKLDDAEPLFRKAQTLFREYYERRPDLAAQAALWRGVIQLKRRAYPEAEILLRANINAFLDSTDICVAERKTALGYLVQLYQERENANEAATWQKKMDDLAKIPIISNTR